MHKLIGFIMILGTAIGTQGCVFKSDHEALLADKASVDQELAATQQPPKSRTGTAADLEDAWRRFEAEQELDELRRRKG